MSDLGYLIWFIATALMIIVVLAVGTMASAGMIGRHPHPRSRDDLDVPNDDDAPADPPAGSVHEQAA